MTTLIAATLPGLAALGALLFTWMQVGQANKELRISDALASSCRWLVAVVPGSGASPGCGLP
jgi:hypothetical protein